MISKVQSSVLSIRSPMLTISSYALLYCIVSVLYSTCINFVLKNKNKFISEQEKK